MVYTATTWAEVGMTTQNKVDGLNNLETIYSELVSYIDAMTHATSYYTDAQAAARYFGSGSDGTGSGLIAATLDGMTAQQIIDSGTPSGCIGMWSSTVGSIPDGWYLCDGSNGTPDLRDKFVVGAGGNYTVGDLGGSNSVTVTGTVGIAAHTLSASEIALHQHTGITDYYGSGTANKMGNQPSQLVMSASNTDVSRDTGSTGDGGSHSHSGSFAGTSNQDKRQAFYALAYIMKA